MYSPKGTLVLTMALLVFGSIVPGSIQWGFKQPTTTVEIENYLEAQVHLFVHCKDKNHDIPEARIPYQQSFQFQVKNVFWPRRADYYCRFVFLSKVHWFDIYVQNRDLKHCKESSGKCTWRIKEAGPCLIGPAAKCYDWNKN